MTLVLCASFLVNLFSVDPDQSVFTMIIMASRYSFSGHCRARALFPIGMYRSCFLNQYGSEAGTADYGGALVRTNEQYATSSISCFGRRYNLYQFANSSQMSWLIEIPSSLILILTILY